MSKLPVFAIERVVAINAVPVAGLLLLDWSSATTLALYWAETLVAVLFTGALIAVHRHRTRKRGHLRPQLGLEIHVGGASTQRRLALPSFLVEFLVAGLGFSLGHALVLLAVLAAFLPGELATGQLIWGAVVSLALQTVGLASDVIGITGRPFAWVRERAQLVLGRSVLIHLALLGGFALLSWQGRTPAVFVPFASLKLLADLAALAPRRASAVELPREPPKWLARLAGQGAKTRWRRTAEEQRTQLEADEEVL